MFTADKCLVTVTYVYIGHNMAHTSFHVPYSTLDIGICSHNETSRIVGRVKLEDKRTSTSIVVRYTKCCIMHANIEGRAPGFTRCTKCH